MCVRQWSFVLVIKSDSLLILQYHEVRIADKFVNCLFNLSFSDFSTGLVLFSSGILPTLSLQNDCKEPCLKSGVS